MDTNQTDSFYDAIDSVFGRLSEMQKRMAVKKIAEMENSLEKLEEELTYIINTHSQTLTKNYKEI